MGRKHEPEGCLMVGFLTEREAEYCEGLLAEFKRDGFLPALVNAVEQGGLNTANMPFLFELRYAKSLKDRGINPDYERNTLNATSVDFGFTTVVGTPVLAELVSISVSEAVQSATQHQVDEDGIEWSQLILCTNNEVRRFSEEGEVLLVQQKICEKVYRNAQAIKFPRPPNDGTLNVLIVDMRAFLGGNGGDNADCVQLTFGNAHVNEWARRFWDDPTAGQRVPIRGLFEATDRPRGAPTLRERVHGIFFTRDTGYADGKIIEHSFLVQNPHLITSQAELDRLRAAVCD